MFFDLNTVSIWQLNRSYILLALLVLLLAPAPQTGSAQSGLDPGGPWLIYSAASGLIAANPDGSGQITLALRPDAETTFRAAPAPTGDRLILITQKLPGSDPAASLRLITLPGGGSRLLIGSLLPPETTPAMGRSYALNAFNPAAGGPVWSPGGERLVYTSAHEGQPQLYLYTAASGSSIRLTDSDTYPANPIWSPNGRRLIWQERLHAGHGGAAAVMMVSFASESGRVPSAGPAALDLTSPDDGGGVREGEEWVFVGWQTPDRFLYSAHDARTGAEGLYVYDCQAGAAAPLLPPTAITPPAFDAASGMAVFAVPQAAAGMESGVYRLDTWRGAVTRILPGSAESVHWLPGLSAFSINQAGSISLLPPDAPAVTATLNWQGMVFPAPRGEQLAYYRSGGFMQGPALAAASGPTAPPNLVWEGVSSLPVWSPDGHMIYAIVSDGAAHSLIASADGAGEYTVLDPRARPDVLLMLVPREVAVFADVEIPLRERPADSAAIQATLDGDEPITRLRGRNRAANWLMIRLADGREGWVQTAALTTSGAIESLPILAN